MLLNILDFFISAVYTAFNGFEYAYIGTPLSWNAAANVCSGDGGALASIHTRAENDFVYSLNPTPYVSRWIGGYLLRISSPQTPPFNWAWSDGSQFDIFTNSSNGYNPTSSCTRTSTPSRCLFSIGEPNDSLGSGSDCLRMGIAPPSGQLTSKALPYEWNDAGCQFAAAFVCKRLPQPSSSSAYKICFMTLTYITFRLNCSRYFPCDVRYYCSGHNSQLASRLDSYRSLAQPFFSRHLHRRHCQMDLRRRFKYTSNHGRQYPAFVRLRHRCCWRSIFVHFHTSGNIPVCRSSRWSHRPCNC